jgi:conjugal transfer pilus assembly protein TraW
MKKTLLALLLLLSSNIAVAKDYGIHGNTYEIKEQSFLDQIQAKLKKLEKSGELAKMQQKMKEKTFESVNQPKAVKDLTRASVNKEWIYDKSVTLEKDLADQNGRVFYKAGTKVNPLDRISMTKTLIFIDGSDEEQVKWALIQNKKKRVKIILTSGQIIKLMKSKKVRFYFDQNGTLIKKFSINHVPASVEQDGKSLLVKEIAL